VRPVIPFVVAVPRKKLLPVAAPAKGSARASRLGEGVWLVTVHGEHDLTTQDSLAAAIQLVDFSGAVIIDFSDADFIDTSTLAVLLHAAEVARGQGGVVLCVSPPMGHPYRLFEITYIGSLLSIYETRDEALRAVPAERRGDGS
jgi:anti-anti-sigma factor